MSNTGSMSASVKDIRDSILDDETRFSGGAMPQFTHYHYAGTIVAGGNFFPPTLTIVLHAVLNIGGSGSDISTTYYGQHIASNSALDGTNKAGIVGAFIADASHLGIHNGTAAQRTLNVDGLTMRV